MNEVNKYGTCPQNAKTKAGQYLYLKNNTYLSIITCTNSLYYFRISWGNPDFINIGLGETIDIDTKKLSLPLGPNSFTGMIDTISFSSPESGAQVTVGMYNTLSIFRTI